MRLRGKLVTISKLVGHSSRERKVVQVGGGVRLAEEALGASARGQFEHQLYGERVCGGRLHLVGQVLPHLASRRDDSQCPI